jgi:diguanylate cyclase (GGDEF)-like protein
MAYKWIITGYASFIGLSSMLIQQSKHPALVLSSLALFVALTFLPSRGKLRSWLHGGALFAFHWTVQPWWCLFLYLLVLSPIWNRQPNFRLAGLVGLGYAVIYLLIISPFLGELAFPENVLTCAFVLACFLLGMTISYHVGQRLRRTEQQLREKTLLGMRDALTGLINYEEAHRRLEKLIAGGEPLMLVLIDCTDLKSMNVAKGYRAGNLILKQVADLLQISFSDAHLIARYGGDEFALALPLGGDLERMTAFVRQLLDSELPKLTGIRMTYGIACYPYNAGTKDELVMEAEKRLYMKKREIWLEREEHMMRSEKMRVVGELASGMAHEIRNPLTAVKGFLQISKAHRYNIEQWYDLIMNEINRMSDLTAEFLHFSKPHNSEYRLVPLQSCFQRVIALTETEASRLGMRLVYEHPDEPLLMRMDQDKLVQLLLNLVKNAYEAMPDGGLLFLGLRQLGRTAVIEVEDTGTGIPSERLHHIFNPFYTTKEYGTGLGLSISHKIVQDHEGTMEVESVVGEGTKFVITFPISSEEDEAAAGEPAEASG